MISAGWLVSASSDGLLALGPAAEMRFELERPASDPSELLRAIAGGTDADLLAAASGLSHGAATEMIAALVDAGAITEGRPEPTVGHCLRSAITDGRAATGSHEVIWTAEEALLLPTGLAAAARTAVIRSFIAGSEPFARLRAYAHLVNRSGDVAGDQPEPDLLDALLSKHPIAADSIVVINLPEGTSSTPLTPEQFAQLDAGGAHRLGPIARMYPPENFENEGIPDLHYVVAEIAEVMLDRPSPAVDRRVQGSGGREHSSLTARAEGAERFALAIRGNKKLRECAFEDLEGAVEPASIFAYNDRQLDALGHDPAHRGTRSWCAAETFHGELRWVPAELAGVSAEQPLPTTSSGVAAHTDPALARSAALSELIERDAFMWTWIQRVSRELIEPSGIPAGVAGWAAALERQGWKPHWVNLSMELQPAILCCLVNKAGGLVVGAASRPDPAAALRKATLEALVLALRFDPAEYPTAPIEQTRSPADHLMLHLDPDRAPSNQFLYSSTETIALDEIEPGTRLEDALSAIGVEPVFINLSVPQARPFLVFRAVAPGLVPLSFGWDGEPLGLARPASSRERRDRVRIGRSLALSSAGPLGPHPFA